MTDRCDDPAADRSRWLRNAMQREARLQAHIPADVNAYTFLPYAELDDRRAERRWAPWLSRTFPDLTQAKVRWSGALDVTLRVVTPVAIYGGVALRHPPTHDVRRADTDDGAGPSFKLVAWTPDERQDGTEQEAADEDYHERIRLRVDERGLPTIPGASIKGVLRSVYEVITGSKRPTTTPWRTKGRTKRHSSFEDRTPERYRNELRDDDQHLLPATRVFGTAAPPLLLAGRVRVGAARWSDLAQTPDRRFYPLPRLGAPQPLAAAWYLDGPDHVAWEADEETDGLDQGHLAGTKVYWHTPPPDDEPPDARLRLAPIDPSTGTHAFLPNSTTVEAVRNGAFTVTVHFEDLTNDELGALLLASSLRFCEDEAPRGWKLGQGKPLGFGSVENEVTGVRYYDLDARLADPCDPEAGLRSLEPRQITELEEQARATYLDAAQRSVLDGVFQLYGLADSDAQHEQARAVGYMGIGSAKRTDDGWPRARNAHEILEEGLPSLANSHAVVPPDGSEPT